MKKFKLNSFEKFVIRNKKVLVTCVWISYFILLILLFHFKSNIVIPTGTFFLALPLLLIYLYIVFLPMYKNAKVVNAYRNLDIDTALDGACSLLEVSKSKDYTLAPICHNDKAAFLIEAGRLSEAEEELKLFFRLFDTKKLSSSLLFVVHINYANLKIYQGDENGYREQIEITNGYYNKICKSGNKNQISKLNQIYNGTKYFAEAVFYAYSEDFEQKVLNHIKSIDSKDKKVNELLDSFFGYFHLFTYFARFENTEKAVYYAEKVTEIGNDGLLAYRRAKEYLENANKCN